jgi:hypothetical protein
MMEKRFLHIFLLLFILAVQGIRAQEVVNHWETIVFSFNEWHFRAGSADIPVEWKDPGFDASSWETGRGGIGYGDGDDETVIPETISLFMRLDFEVLDTGKIAMALLHADYDDAFVAYLNGKEIARSNIGEPGVPPSWDDKAMENHEAAMKDGGNPELFQIPKAALDTLLVNGTNTLAMQVHNRDATSSDMSAIFFLSVGITDVDHYYWYPPDWFYAPFESSDLPLMMIETSGQTIGSGERIIADMGLMDYTSSGKRNTLTDSCNVYSGKISIKIRGSSSQMFPKKNYNFETQDDTGANRNVPLLGMPEENDWVLHGPYTDKTLIRNVLSYHIAAATKSYAPRTRWIELFINNQYTGVYVLTEKIKQDHDRVDIAELDPEDISGDQLTGGYIFQIDRDDPEPDDGWYSAYRENVFYAYHDPGYDQLVPEQKTYIRDFVSGFEDAVKSASSEADFLSYIDVNSFADYWIPTEIYKHVDGYKLSFYMYKEIDSRGGRLHFGPVWDLDLAYGNSDFGEEPVPQGWSWTLAETSSIRPFWITDLMATDTIRNCIACKWQELRAGALSTDALMQFIDDNLETIEEARIRNFARWPVLGIYIWPNYYVGADYGDDVDFLKEWLTTRLDWMDANMVGTCIPAGNGPVPVTRRSAAFPNPFTDLITFSFEQAAGPVRIEIYSATGQLLRVSEPTAANSLQMNLGDLHPGIYIYRLISSDRVYDAGKVVRK